MSKTSSETRRVVTGYMIKHSVFRVLYELESRMSLPSLP